MSTKGACLLALLLSAAGHTFAQNIKAALNGRVLDSQNNAVANAAIIVTDTERGQSRSLVSARSSSFSSGASSNREASENDVYAMNIDGSGIVPLTASLSLDAAEGLPDWGR